MMDEGLLKVASAAKFLDVSTSFLYELMADGSLPYTTIGRVRRIPLSALKTLAAKGLINRTAPVVRHLTVL